MPTYRYSSALASISFSQGGFPVPRPGVFCLVSEDRGVNVALSGGAIKALITSQSGWQGVVPAGFFQLPLSGWYRIEVGQYSTLGQSQPPQALLTYLERYLADDVQLPGLSYPALVNATAKVNRPSKSLGVFKERFLFDLRNLDDDLYLSMDGKTILTKTFNQIGVYELTQRVPEGRHTFTLLTKDQNEGKCWHLRYRLGDAESWKYADHYGNRTCKRPLPKKVATTYEIKFTVTMRP